MGQQEAVADRGLDQASLRTQSPTSSHGLRYLFLFFRLRAAPCRSSPGQGGVGGAPCGCGVIIFGVQGRNVVVFLFVCLTRDLDPRKLVGPIGGSGDHWCFPSWVSCVGSLMESPLQLPTRLSQLEGAPCGLRGVGGGPSLVSAGGSCPALGSLGRRCSRSSAILSCPLCSGGASGAES